jgi:NADH:ubiquinone oxidoreductase subunit 5 (subunit L)/multisubunit Na+/H+ antiporter MnhA subunit
MKFKRPIYLATGIMVVVVSLLLAIPATWHSTFFIDGEADKFKMECRTWDIFTMVICYSIASSLLFCFTMSFLFSLCILGSPLLREAYDPEEHTQRWRLLLTLSLVNIFYIITGFLLNFKVVSVFIYECCKFMEPYNGINTILYEVFSFILLASEPLFRPLVFLTFYLTYLLNNDNVY